MHGFALAFLGLTVAADPELPKDVVIVPMRQVKMPLVFAPDGRTGIVTIRLFVSQDQGKTWKHSNDFRPSEDQVTYVTYAAPHDGLYWFAFQIVLEDGKCEPPTEAALAPEMKVFVKTEREMLVAQKSGEKSPREGNQPQSAVAKPRSESPNAKIQAEPKDESDPLNADLYRPQAGAGAQAGKVVFSWSASGGNIADRPVSLYYAATQDGPWHPIATSLEKKGSFAWCRPNDVPASVFLRMSARNRAGMVVIAQTNQLIQIDLK